MNIARKAAALFLAFLTLMLPISTYAENGAVLQASAFGNVNTVPGLTLTTDQSIYSPYSLVLKVRFRNKTSRGYDYGAQYYLEKYVDGQWYTFVDPDFIAYPAIGYYLAAKGSTKHTLTITDSTGFYRYHGQIEPGAYRIVQTMRDEQTNETVYLAAEFFVADIPLYAKEPVYLRTGPSVNYGVIRELTWGERVSYIRKSGKWTLVRAGDQTGYVYGKYLAQFETDCYNDNSAMRLLRAAGVKNARASEVYADGSYIACDDRGIPYSCDRCVMIEWTKPYGGFLWMMIYADNASAQKKFAELANASESLRTDYSYFLSGRFILRRVNGTPIGLPQRGQVFYDKFLNALIQACDGYLRIENHAEPQDYAGAVKVAKLPGDDAKWKYIAIADTATRLTQDAAVRAFPDDPAYRSPIDPPVIRAGKAVTCIGFSDDGKWAFIKYDWTLTGTTKYSANFACVDSSMIELSFPGVTG